MSMKIQRIVVLVFVFFASFVYQPNWVYENFWSKAEFWETLPFTMPYRGYEFLYAVIATVFANFTIKAIKKYL